MVQDSAKGLFDTVLVWKLDRFARNRYDSAYYKAQLRKNGVKVVSANDDCAGRFTSDMRRGRQPAASSIPSTKGIS